MLNVGCVVVVYGEDGVKHFRDEWRQRMWRHWFLAIEKHESVGRVGRLLVVQEVEEVRERLVVRAVKQRELQLGC